ncbi:MAG: Na+/H+ antiporter [Anaerolineae bacterium]|nr:Na+/H+ antiporter [Anaerolineae bacterium]
MQIFQVETIVIELLLIISLVAIAIQRLRLPYTVALVAVGLLVSLLQPFQIDLTPDLILAIFVPPLVFEAAFHLDLGELKRNLPGILVFAVPGVLVTTFLVGGLLTLIGALELRMALVFGALIAATDPVAIIALFRTLGVPKRLGVIVEGESLFNDGTAIVVFDLMLGMALTGEADLFTGIFDFVRVAAGGIAVGIVFGYAVAWLIARVDDHLIEITLTTVVAFGSYLLAENLHASGVLAVVAAGLLNGNVGIRGMSPTTRIILNHFWEYVAFLANSFVFLLIGLDVNLPHLATVWQPILLAIIAVLVARFVVIYGLGLLANRLGEPIPRSFSHVLAWGGLRGAISLALVLSLPFTIGEDRSLLTSMTFGVVLFTLFVQGTTIRLLLRRLGLLKRNTEAETEYETRHARLVTMQAAETHLHMLQRKGLISSYTWDELKPQLSEDITSMSASLRELLRSDPQLADENLETARLEMLRARRSALNELRASGIISEEAFEAVAVELDQALNDIENHDPNAEKLLESLSTPTLPVPPTVPPPTES